MTTLELVAGRGGAKVQPQRLESRSRARLDWPKTRLPGIARVDPLIMWAFQRSQVMDLIRLISLRSRLCSASSP
jgi:hypothetical protein